MFGHYLEILRERSALVHNITNYVTVNDVANVLLAAGASPIMADEAEDAEAITEICGGLCINIGTLNRQTIGAMFAAGRRAAERGHILVLDPVGAGASPLRTETAQALMRELPFAAIRGNMSEIKTLATGSGTTKGVDADVADAVTPDNLERAVSFVKAFAAEIDSVVAVTGALDIVTDGEHGYVIENGRPEMGRITGTGCQLSALLTAFLVADGDSEHRTEAAAAAVATMGLAGEIGWSRMRPGDGNTTYRNRIIDAIFNMDGPTLDGGVRYREMIEREDG